MKHRVTVRANEKSHHEPEKLDLIVRGGRVVTAEGVVDADLGIVHGKFARLAPSVGDDALAELDAAGKYVFPGIIDGQVRFNEPGRTDWEGVASGSAALGAGGGTMFFDLPLKSEPPVLDAATLREKRRIAEEQACTDFALWGGLTPGNLDKLAGLRDAGAIGLKAFLCNTGTASFPRMDAKSLHEGMKRAAKLGLLVAVHAEDETMTAALAEQMKAAGRTDARAWLDSRPIEAELTAVRLALELAGETGCALHIAPVSSPEAVALIQEARLQRVDVTAGTSPHYLLLNDKDVERIGPLAKCAPPVRDEKHRKAMWAELRAGRIHSLGSDHSPARPEMKDSANMFAVWGGIAGIQHGAELLISECAKTADKDLPVLAAVLARNMARRFQIDDRKGQIKLWHDADFTLVEFGKARTIEEDDLWTRHRISAYVGQKSRALITHTYVRGSAIYADGRLVNLPKPGQFLAPHRT